ncbi:MULTISPECIES: hypothetical protein [Bradyrhizobium]|jgi:hypothetical protein|uniref:hypothetical protein n=1 Tax=Bradyrhizobium TaxID=374 RepID=UPI0003A6660F|nr:hypothetical protein [Bradyrhizobium denitrificans]MCL8489354.1 hypothetical protein [Bradyrhizobium denitrificans]
MRLPHPYLDGLSTVADVMARSTAEERVKIAALLLAVGEREAALAIGEAIVSEVNDWGKPRRAAH